MFELIVERVGCGSKYVFARGDSYEQLRSIVAAMPPGHFWSIEKA